MVALSFRCWGDFVSDDGIFFFSSFDFFRTHSQKRCQVRSGELAGGSSFNGRAPCCRRYEVGRALGLGGTEWEALGLWDYGRVMGQASLEVSRIVGLWDPCRRNGDPWMNRAFRSTLPLSARPVQPLSGHCIGCFHSAFPSQTRRSEVGSGRLFAQHLFVSSLLWTVYFSTPQDGHVKHIICYLCRT